MPEDQFNELMKRKFAELERKLGRVPTIQELADALKDLADTLGVDSRSLARKLKNALGSSAFKSASNEQMPGFMQLNMLLNQAQRDPNHFSKLHWKIGRRDYSIRVSWDDVRGHGWFMAGPTGMLFSRVTNEVGDVVALIQAIANGEKVDAELITHMHGEPVPFKPEDLPYQDPIPADQLPPNVLPFRKPYQHSDE